MACGTIQVKCVSFQTKLLFSVAKGCVIFFLRFAIWFTNPILRIIYGNL